MQVVGLNVSRPLVCLSNVIPEIDIWRAATLRLKRYGENALEESTKRVDELAAGEDYDGAETRRRTRGRRGLRRGGYLAPDHHSCRATRQQHTARTTSLIGTASKQPGSP